MDCVCTMLFSLRAHLSGEGDWEEQLGGEEGRAGKEACALSRSERSVTETAAVQARVRAGGRRSGGMDKCAKLSTTCCEKMTSDCDCMKEQNMQLLDGRKGPCCAATASVCSLILAAFLLLGVAWCGNTIPTNMHGQGRKTLSHLFAVLLPWHERCSSPPLIVPILVLTRQQPLTAHSSLNPSAFGVDFL